MSVVRLSRTYSFSASHRLFLPELSQAKNREIYGKCANPFGHGHDYRVEITVSGAVDAVTGRAVNLQELDTLVDREVLSAFRYRYLNEEIEAFRKAVPTTENLVWEVDRRLRSAWGAQFGSGAATPRLERVRIWETDRNICELTE